VCADGNDVAVGRGGTSAALQAWAQVVWLRGARELSASAPSRVTLLLTSLRLHAPLSVGGKFAMPAGDAAAEQELRHVQAELDALQGRGHEQLITTRAACEAIAAAVERTPEPLATDQQKANPWVASSVGSGGCCTVS
jgi:hypothetical protein